MVRNYKRKTTPYNHEDMEKAVASVTSGEMGYKRAAKLYGLKWETIRDHVKRKYSKMGAGRPTSLTSEEEKELVTCLKLLSTWGFGLTRAETQEVVGEYIKAIGRSTQFVDGVPGPDWLDSFFKRHPQLTLRLPEQLKASRAKSSANRNIYDHWFTLLGDILREHGLMGKPERIYNVDESGFPLDPKRIKVIAEKGVPHLFRLIGGSGRENITVQGCARADGLMLPPYVLYAAKNLRSKWTENGPEGARYNANDKGWMDMICFHDWFCSAFVTSLPPERPVILIFDGHASHINLATIQEARRQDIIILKLPSNTTHVLQPLDVGVYGPVKTKWEKILVSFARQNLGVPLSKELFPHLLKTLWESECLKPDNIKAGFRKCGIMPFDPSKISSSHYESAEIFDRPLTLTAQPFLPTSDLCVSTSTSSTPLPQPSSSSTPLPQPSSSSTPLPQLSSSSTPLPQPSSSKTPLPQPSSSSTPLPQPSLSSTPLPQPSSSSTPLPQLSSSSTPSPQPSSGPCACRGKSVSISPKKSVSVKDFLVAKITPMVRKPRDSTVNRQRAIRRQFGESLTSQDCYERLVEEQNERAAKKSKGKGKGRGKKSITVPEVVGHHSGDMESDTEVQPRQPSPTASSNDSDFDISDSEDDPEWVPKRPAPSARRNIFEIDF